MQVGVFFGFVNIFFLCLLLSLYVTKKFFRKSHRLIAVLRAIHPWSAVLLVVSIVIHAWIVWGIPDLNSGHIILFFILAAIFTALFGRKLFPRYWIRVHQICAILALCALGVHLLA